MLNNLTTLSVMASFLCGLLFLVLPFLHSHSCVCETLHSFYKSKAKQLESGAVCFAYLLARIPPTTVQFTPPWLLSREKFRLFIALDVATSWLYTGVCWELGSV